ncbi:MAG TPA: sigma-54 dependent transcriptional regulator [Nitrospirota bacterium]|nr:sigma-54 dependent transcriptional regulator [Nitrospirota bacterium]
MNVKGSILIIDDEPDILLVMSANLKKEGYEVETADDGESALRKLENRDFDAIIVDHQMPRLTGMELLSRLRSGLGAGHVRSTIPVLVVTAYGTIEMAVRAMKDGAYSYLTKPIQYEELSLQVKNAIERRRLSREVENLRHEVEERYQFGNILGRNPQMQETFQLVRTVAETDATVLIQGESGTGKELIARAIHYNSRRKDLPFIIVSCSALPETLLESELFGHEKGAFTGAIRQRVGRFELADGGTIFLDEIGEMSMPVQLKLLRVLQEREFERVGGNRTVKVDVRVLAATHKDLFRAMSERMFREDLFYRLNVLPIKLPPLRDRLDDVPLLAAHFLKKYAEKNKKSISSISPEALALLMRYSYPGNVRELENIIERAVIMEKSDVLSAVDLRRMGGSRGGVPLPVDDILQFRKAKTEVVAQFEKEYFIRLLRMFGGNMSRAAKHAGMDIKNLHEKMARYGLKKEEFK